MGWIGIAEATATAAADLDVVDEGCRLVLVLIRALLVGDKRGSNGDGGVAVV